MTDDELRQRILELSPELRLDVKVLTDIFRKQVEIERAKLGLDQFTGDLWLKPNTDKKRAPKSSAPDLLGTGRVAGRLYEAAAWIKGKQLHLTLREPLRKSHHKT